MSGGTDGWSSVPARDPGHVDDTADGLEARRTHATSAAGAQDGRVHGRPAPHYGEYAPEGWVNPVLEHERREQQRLEQAKRPAEPVTVTEAPARATPAAGRFGASPRDFVLTIGLLVIGLWSVIESLSVGRIASAFRIGIERQSTELADPGALSQAAAVRAVVMAIVFVLVAWWSIRRLRAGRRTFWVPLIGGVVATVLGVVPLLIVLFQDPAFMDYVHRMTPGG
ncbi:DUF6264 family protein [Curtobacterium sp. 1544]|uniref:DUF6264 family protein n=1 Tax=Curtobacterium sp. 1544 TaxID=3156417 RepID=UPI00339B4289